MIKKSDECYADIRIDKETIYTLCQTPYGEVRVLGLHLGDLDDEVYASLAKLSEAFLMRFGTCMVDVVPSGISCIKKKAIVEVEDGEG